MNKPHSQAEEAANLARLLGDRNKAEFAREFGVPGGPSMISQHCSGHRPISIGAAAAYAKGLGVSLEEISPRLAEEIAKLPMLATGKDGLEPGEPHETRQDRASYNVVPSDIGTSRIPLLTSIQAGAWKEIESQFQPSDAETWLITDCTISSHAFALRIVGNSMEPKFTAGDVVIIDPAVAPSPGDFVVARNGKQEATFKKYRPRGIDAQGNTVFELVPLNDDYPTMRSDQEHISILGVMMEHRQFRRK